jgi:hypothetical protein
MEKFKAAQDAVFHVIEQDDAVEPDRPIVEYRSRQSLWR